MRFSSMVDRVEGLGSALWEPHTRALAMQQDGDDVIVLTLGEPDFETPSEVVDAAVLAMKAGRTRYAPGRGEAEVREAIARKYASEWGRTVDAEQVLYLPGTQTALYVMIMALAEPGDEVLVPEPYYVTYPSLVAAAGARFVSVPLDADGGFHLTADALQDAVTDNSRVLLLNSPHNPTGATLSRDELVGIADVVAANDLWVISDEVYADLIEPGQRCSISTLDGMSHRTVVVSSLSKSHAMTGWRSGWAVGSADLVSRVAPLADAMLFGCQPFLQDAAAFALTHHLPEVDGMIESYRRRAGLVVDLLANTAGVTCTRPDAGMFVMADVRSSGLSGHEWATRLLDECGVAVMPGLAFGPSAGSYVRISVLADDELLQEACARINTFGRRLALNG